ncbi:Zeamatin precursor, putative [Ricinus communis]|uniref:Zeamatin, putative n=1 Tax=Ricinus communis TaxID=3988 RepID=B9SUI9_RICCO|nr:Zeamatin precursor, putative [Ricinus communis]|eukprot:XP_002529658.1 thaumatin-like protein 1 [Ricinus communis]
MASLFFISLTFLSFLKGATCATFTLINKCDYTVWPGILGNPKLDSTGFELPKGSSRSFQAPTGWSGRFWGRTGCTFDTSGHGSCSTADCGSSQLECNGNSAAPPATLAEFTLGSGSQDFYDVSLVDGYNLPMLVEVNGGSGECASTGCVADLNRKCPTELRVEGGGACRSACEAFGNPEYCCSGAYSSPSTCKPSTYSQVFKSACPKSYSYAFDDASSTFTCTGADYTITFCPSLPSLKSASDSSPKTTDQTGPGTEEGLAGSTNSESGEVEEAALASSWLASLATGASTRTHHPFSLVQLALVLATSLILCYIHL